MNSVTRCLRLALVVGTSILFLFLDLLVRSRLESNVKMFSCGLDVFPSFVAVVVPSILVTTYKESNIKEGLSIIFAFFFGGSIYEFLQLYIPSRTYDVLDLAALSGGFIFSSLVHISLPVIHVEKIVTGEVASDKK